MNNINAILTFSDNDIGIVLFNSEGKDQIILFQDKVKLEQGIIINGFVNEMPLVLNIAKNLIHDASMFTGYQIKAMYCSVIVNEIWIRNFEMNDITLPNGVLNQLEWEDLKKSINVSQGANKYIYNIEYETWVVDGRSYNCIDSQIVGNKLDIKAKMFQISKVLYKQYLNLFSKLQIRPISLKPVINDLAQLVEANKNTHYELFVTLTNKSLCFIETRGDKIEKSVYSDELGLNSLYKKIALENKLNERQVQNMLHRIWSHYGNLNNFDIINAVSDKLLNVSIVDSNRITETIANFVKSIVNFAEDNANYLIKDKHILIKKISYITLDKLTAKMFSLIGIYSKLNSHIPINPYEGEYGREFMQDWLLINSITKNNKKIKCIDNLTKKEIKQIRELNKG